MIAVGVSLGYCGDCRQAAVVVYVELPGWDHAFPICPSCLRTLAAEASNLERVTLREMAKRIVEAGR